MIKNILNKHKIALVPIILFIVSYTVAVADWSTPGAAYPDGNNIPINSGTVSQVKSGYFGVISSLTTTNLWSSSTLAIGTDPSNLSEVPSSRGLSVLIKGKVGSSGLCTTDGSNCVTEAQGQFDNPDYVSQWTYMNPGTNQTITHNLNSLNTFVFMETYTTSDVGNDESNYGFGGDTAVSNGATTGYWWSDKKINTIKINNGATYQRYVRITMWRLDNNKATSTVYHQSKIPNVPSGAVIGFDAPDCPMGWTEFSQLNTGRYLMGSSGAGSTGGSASVSLNSSHLPEHNHSYSKFKPAIGNYGRGGGDRDAHKPNCNPAESSLCTVPYTYTTTNSSSVGQSTPIPLLPSYYSLRFCKKS